MSLHPERKAQWVAALRSGEYKQATGALRTADGFCCLGVLCDLYAKSDEGKRVGAEWYDGTFAVEGRTEGDSLVAPVMEWIGVTDSLGSDVEIDFGGDGIPKSNNLAEHNDCGATFAEIADAIEAQL